MKMRKIILLTSSFLLLSLVSCQDLNQSTHSPTSNEKTNAPTETIEKIDSFNALGKVYHVNKDLSILSKGSVVYDPANNKYKEGEYAEIDFAKDLLIGYLNEDTSIYDYLVSLDNNSKEDKDKLQKNLSLLKEEMSFLPNDKVVVIIDKVTYEGEDTKASNGLTLNMRIGISHVGATTAPWVSYTVTVFKEGNTFKAHLL